MISQKKYTRRHLPIMTPRHLEKSAEGFVAQSCMDSHDMRRGVQTPRVCYANADTNACPPGYKFALNPIPVGYNWGRVCNEYDVPCVRSEYPLDDATLTKCCLGQQSEQECDSRYCPQSQECRNFMLGKCDSDANFLSGDCQAWMNRAGNEDARQNIMSRRCSADMMYGESPCRKFCTDNDGQCDTQMLKYCATPRCSDFTMWGYCDANPSMCSPNPMYKSCIKNYGAGDDICSCINSTLKTANQTVAPVPCFDDKCVKSGYQTNDMTRISANCPTYVDCRAVLQSGDTATIQNSYIQQNCGAEFKSISDAAAKQKADEEAARLKADQAKNVPSTPPPAATPTSNPIPSVGGVNAKFADAAQLGATGAALFGNMTVGEVLLIFVILAIVLGVLYMTWTRQKARELESLEMMEAQRQQLVQSKEEEIVGARQERMREIDKMIADLPPVGHQQ